MKTLYLLLAGLLLAMLLSGCAAGVTVGGTTGTLVVNATDAPPANDVTAILVTVASVRVHLAGTDGTATTASDNGTESTLTSDTTTDGGGQWLDVPLSDNATTFDLLQIQGVLHELGSANLTAGTYTQVRLEVTKVQVGLNGEAPQDATLPSGVLKVVRPFQVTAGMTTELTFDFDADRMVTVTGNGKVMVKPVIKLSVTPPSPPAGTPSPTPTPSSTDNTTSSANATG